jgi:hypothetical protein
MSKYKMDFELNPMNRAKHTVDKIFEVLEEEEVAPDEACALLFSLLLAFHTNFFKDGDRHVAALDLAGLYTELADKIDALGKRSMRGQH